MIKVYKFNPDAILPTRKHSTDAGIDLYYVGDDFNLKPGAMRILSIGITVVIPENFFGFIADKSRNMFDILGRIVDNGYAGEVLVKVINTTNDLIGFKHNQAIAQLILIPCLTEEVYEIDCMGNPTERGATGGIVDQLPSKP